MRVTHVSATARMRQAWSLLLLLGCVLSGKEAHPILRKFDTDRNQGELEGLNSLDTANLDGVPCIRLRKLAHALSCVTGASVGGSGRIVRISEDMKDVVLYNSSDLVNLTVATSCSTFNETQFLTLYSEVTRFSPDIITIVLTECAQIENSSGGNMDVMQVSLYVDVSQTISFDDPPKPQPQTQKAFEEGAFQAAGLDVIAVGPFSSPSSTPQPHPQNEPASAVAENGSSGPSVLMATLAGGAAFLFVLLAAAASWKMIQASNRRCFVCIEGTITASRRTAKRPCSQCKDSLKSGTRTLYLCSECLSRGAPGKRAIMCARRKATLEAKELDRVDVRNVCGGGVEAFYCFKGHHFAHIREKAPAVQRSGVFCVSCLQLHTARSQRREARSSTSPSSSDGQVISTPPTEQITPATVPGSEAPPQVSDLERPTLSQEECRSWDSGHVVGPQETVLEELPTQSGATHWPLDDLHSGMELDPTFGLEPDGPNLQPALGFDDQFELDVFDSSLPPAAIELQF